MDFIEMSIQTTSEGVDTLVTVLEDMGVNGFTIEDSRDFNEFLETVTPHWDYVDEDLMKLTDAPDRRQNISGGQRPGPRAHSGSAQEIRRITRAGCFKKLGELAATFKGVHEEDWANAYKKYFKPFPVGERLVIKPLMGGI